MFKRLVASAIVAGAVFCFCATSSSATPITGVSSLTAGFKPMEAIPEPATMSLFGLGLLILAARLSRKRRQSSSSR